MIYLSCWQLRWSCCDYCITGHSELEKCSLERDVCFIDQCIDILYALFVCCLNWLSDNVCDNVCVRVLCNVADIHVCTCYIVYFDSCCFE